MRARFIHVFACRKPRGVWLRGTQQRVMYALGVLALLVMLPGFSGGFIPNVAAASAALTTATTDDWPAYLHDNQRTSSSGDTILSPSNAAQLTNLWTYSTQGLVATSAAVVGGTAYFGSWDGYEYAVDAVTGALKWKTFLGQTTTAPSCGTATPGISSGASVQNGVVYVGGGDAYWYALDASTGTVLWRVYTGDNSATGGHYNWASPLIYNGYAYIGIASYGDCPLVQGQVLQVSLTTHQVVNTLNLVPNGQIGAGVWTSPSIDPQTNTIYVTTGTINEVSQTLAEALVAFDASTMTITSSWQLPRSVAVGDSDWGTTPILFSDANGRKLVAAINKNGYLYAFDRGNVGNGPVWQRQVAVGGACPQCGDGSVASLAFGNGMLFVAGGNTTINGTGYAGFVRALDPATGNSLWEHGDPSTVIPALAYDNGLVLAGAGPLFEVLDATTGTRLYSYKTGAVLYGAPSVSHGIIYVGSVDKNLYAFGLSSTPPPPAPDPQCPAGWLCQDVGSPSPVGSESVSGSTWTVQAGGAGVTGTSDQFRLISQAASGDTQIAARVVSQTATSATSQTGLMVRQSSDPTAPYYAVIATPNGGLRVQYRTAFGGATTIANKITAAALPLYLEIQRTGDTFQAATSSDGVSYTLIPGTNATDAMPAAVLTGVAVSSGANGTLGTTSVSNVSVGTPTTAPTAAPSASPCPAGWSCQDVGNPTLVGNQTLASGVWTVQGGGGDINGYADQFHFVWQPIAGDATLSTHVTAQTNTSTGAKAGVMVRQSTNAGAIYYAAFVTPGKGILIQYRSNQGLRTTQMTSISGSVPAYLQIARSLNTFSTYTSSDGVSWSYVPGTTVTLNFSGTVLAGLAVASANGGSSSTATMDTVTLNASATPSPVGCPTGWSCGDVGYALPAGNESLNNGTWTIQGGGNDIWSNGDQFHFDWQTLSGDGTISAQILSQTQTAAWAKAGVMLRATTDAASPFYAVLMTPSNGIAVEYRTAAGGYAAQQVDVIGVTPLYLRVARSGTTFTAYTSTDNVTWTAIPGSAMTLSNLTAAMLGGMAVTSHNGGTLSTVTLDTVALSTSAPPPPGACPTSWNCADVGAPYLAGTQDVSNGVWSIQAGGDDIWSNVDQFHFAWQTLSADGTISAHITSQANTSAWAKAGVMLRATTDTASPYYGAFVTPSNGIVVQYRTAAGSYAAQQAAVSGVVPTYLRITRSGTTFTAYTSSDGTTWTPVAGSTVTISALTGTLLAGLAVTSHNGGILDAVTFDSVSVSTNAPPPPGACPVNWNCADVGNPYLAGTQDVSNGIWNIQGAGDDIWSNVDQFHFAWQTLSADGTISTHITAQTNTSAWAKAGVMLRATTDAASPYYAVLITPGNGITVQYRTTAGGYASQLVAIAGTVPAFLRIDRTGTSYTAYTSSDGSVWSTIPQSTVTLSTLSGALLAGLAVTSHNGGTLGTATFDTVSLSVGTPPAAGACPTSWSCADVGAPYLAGTQDVNNGVWSIQAGGDDIWSNVDQFHFAWQTLSADGSISAHITSQANTSAWAKAGVMLRATTDTASPFYAVLITPGNGIAVEYRTAAGGYAAQQVNVAGTVPTYLSVARAGTTFTAYTSSDGTTWTAIAGSTVTLSTLSGALLAGLAVTSHNGGTLGTVTFDTVSLSTSVPASSTASAVKTVNVKTPTVTP